MSDRNTSTDAIILTIKEQGESNRNVCAFSPELGIFYATLYGGAKSKMRAFVQTFNFGKIYLYTDEVRHTRKISDFDVKSCHPTFRTSLYKMWASNLAAEIILKTKCAGDDKTSFKLFSAYLDGLDACDENNARLGTIRFLWRYLALLGVQPDVHSCVQCGRSLISKSFSEQSGNSVNENHTQIQNDKNDAVYIPSMNGFVCSDCLPYSNNEAQNQNRGLALNEDALLYLAAINELSPGKVRALVIKSTSVYQMKSLVFMLIENACGSKLKSLESGFGIL
ncbi:MAG: DNA repair protein RecO [Treponema sp.]